jgi:hypothetical protein
MSRYLHFLLVSLALTLVAITSTAQQPQDNEPSPASACAMEAGDTRIDCTPPGLLYPPQGQWDISYVRDGMRNFVDNNTSYAMRAANYAGYGNNGKERYQSGDVVMQQCHGGGFLEAFAMLGPSEHTFSSSTRWDQPSWIYQQNLLELPPPAPAPGLENFTRAWRDLGQTVFPSWMVGLFDGAQAGSAPSSKRLFRPVVATVCCPERAVWGT